MRNHKPLISIIIPIYKAERFIHKCLDSIIAQTYTYWEAILVDDGSPDNCGIICDEYAAKDKRFKVIHQENKGVVNARNIALSIATGEYIAFVDSDDYIESNMLEKMATTAITERLDVVWCNLKRIYREYEEIERVTIYSDNDTNIRMLLKTAIPGYLWNKLISKNFWDKCQIISHEKAVMWEDTFISLQLLIHNPKMRMVEEPLYNYNQINENSATARVNIMAKAEKNIINIYEYLVEKDLFKKYSTEFSLLALRLKIAFITENVDKAFTLFPFAHKKIENYNLSYCTKFFYYIAFNSGWLGRQIFKFHFKNKRP